MTVDRGLLDKAINIINNVGQYGPLDATIDSYKQAADYADDARKYAELAESGVADLNNQINRVTVLTTRVEGLEKDVEEAFDTVTKLEVSAQSGTVANADYDKETNTINFTLPSGEDGTDGESTYQIWVRQPGNEGKTEAQFLETINGTDGRDGVDGINGKDGKDGTDGTNGYSAYELAVISGYNGTLEDFNSLNTKSLDKTKNLSDLVDKATARTNLQVPSKTEATDEITAAVSSKASKGANADITALSGLTVALSVAQGGTGAKTATDARTALVAAKSGGNTDITSLGGLDSGVVLRGLNSMEGLGNGVVFDCSDPLEASFGITNTGGGTAVFHNYAKPADGSATAANALVGGYGARPWTGATYSPHSTSAIHFLQDGTASPTNHGGWLRFMVTPLNNTVDNRIQALAVSNNGDTWVGKDVPLGTYKTDIYSGNYNGRGLKQIINTTSEVTLFAPASGGTPTTNFRGSVFGGSWASPSVTDTGASVYLTMAGHDGATHTNARGAVQIMAASTWTASSTPTVIRFGTTATGEVARADRWEIRSNVMTPMTDNTTTLGEASKRLSSIFAANGTVQTSDARLKSEVRSFSEIEIKASKLLAKEIGFFSWLAKIESDGDKAREHVGLTVQRAIDIMESCDLDPMHYGFICHDVWESEKVVVGYDKNDKPIEEVREAGDRYSFRYDQLNLFIAKGFEARLSALESE